MVTLFTRQRDRPGKLKKVRSAISIATIDSGVVSWKFKELDVGWPIVLVTSPADCHFITDSGKADQVVNGLIDTRAKLWGLPENASVTCQVNEACESPKF
jgi:3',5'-cyclic-AMP phosphodiesterase